MKRFYVWLYGVGSSVPFSVADGVSAAVAVDFYDAIAPNLKNGAEVKIMLKSGGGFLEVIIPALVERVHADREKFK